MVVPLALPRDCGTRLLQTVNRARPVGDCTGRGPRNPPLQGPLQQSPTLVTEKAAPCYGGSVHTDQTPFLSCGSVAGSLLPRRKGWVGEECRLPPGHTTQREHPWLCLQAAQPPGHVHTGRLCQEDAADTVPAHSPRTPRLPQAAPPHLGWEAFLSLQGQGPPFPPHWASGTADGRKLASALVISLSPHPL